MGIQRLVSRECPCAAFTLLCLLILLSPPLFAQETTGGIQGTVKDSTDAVIPGATVEITSAALLGKKTVTSDAGGFYHFAQLPPGSYTMTVTAPVFVPQTQRNLDVRTGALQTVNVTLQIGAVQQAVTVEDSESPAG